MTNLENMIRNAIAEHMPKTTIEQVKTRPTGGMTVLVNHTMLSRPLALPFYAKDDERAIVALCSSVYADVITCPFRFKG